MSVLASTSIKDKLARDGKFESKRGIVRTKLGRPGAEPGKLERARRELAKGIGIGKVARGGWRRHRPPAQAGDRGTCRQLT